MFRHWCFGTVFRPSLRGHGALELLVKAVDIAAMCPCKPYACDRVTELPPSVAHLTLRRCFVDGLQPPADCQLRSLRLEDVAREYSGAPPAQPLYLLDWLEKALPRRQWRCQMRSSRWAR